jgi:hypothetical protein
VFVFEGGIVWWAYYRGCEWRRGHWCFRNVALRMYEI